MCMPYCKCMCNMAVCICHIAVRTCHIAVRTCHTAVCSMLTMAAIRLCILVLQLLLHIMLPLRLSPQLKMPPEADFHSAVPGTAPQLVAMHGCCQQAKCIAKGSRGETHCQGKAPGLTQHAKVLVTHICLLFHADTCLPRCQTQIPARSVVGCASRCRALLFNCCRNLTGNPGLCNAIPNITALSPSSFANSALDFPACNASVLAAQAASNTSPASPSSPSASPASSPSPEAGSAQGAGSYHTSPGINVSVSVLVGLCFLLGIFAGLVRIRQQQRRHRVSQQLCHFGPSSGVKLSLSS